MSNVTSGSKRWNVTLWVLQVLLAVAFGASGLMKTGMPFAALNQAMPWTLSVGEPMVRFIGSMELAGAAGMLLPSITRVLPFLTPLAGLGLSTVMLLASGFHLFRGEPEVLPVNFVLGVTASVVALGRSWKAPIPARGTEPRGPVAI
jgi:hypothetical protein